MCIQYSSVARCSLQSGFRYPRPTKRHSLRSSRLCRRRRLLKDAKEKKSMRVVKAEMEMKNLKLYIANRNIMAANEKLRQQALLLIQENQALSFQLQEKMISEHQHRRQSSI